MSPMHHLTPLRVPSGIRVGVLVGMTGADGAFTAGGDFRMDGGVAAADRLGDEPPK